MTSLRQHHLQYSVDCVVAVKNVNVVEVVNIVATVVVVVSVGVDNGVVVQAVAVLIGCLMFGHLCFQASHKHCLL